MEPYNDNLRRVVTVCSGYVHNAYSPLVLLFHDRKRSLTPNEQINLMFHPDVRSTFDNGYYGVEIKNDYNASIMFCITRYSPFLYTLKDSVPFFLVRKHILYRTTLKEIYKRCLLLRKWMDKNCNTCFWARTRCIHTWHNPKTIAKDPYEQQTQFDFIDDTLSSLSEHEWISIADTLKEPDIDNWCHIKRKNKLKHWHSEFAGHVLIPYIATMPDPLRPVLRTRLPLACDFTTIETSKKLLSTRSRDAGKTQRTIKKQCSVCCFGGDSHYNTVCTKYNPRRCKHGAWTKERIVNYTLDRYSAALQKHSRLTLEDAWVIAQLAGICFKVQDATTKRKREWQICSIQFLYSSKNDNAIRIIVSRTTKRLVDNETRSMYTFTTMEELKKFLPSSMLDLLNKASKQLINRELLALWCHVSVLTHTKAYMCYFYNSVSCGFFKHRPPVNAVSIEALARVRMEICYSRKLEYETFLCFNDLIKRFEELPLFEITEEEDDAYIPRLSHCPY